MALTKITTAGITAAAVTEPKLAISGTASSSVWLRGDMAWSTIPGDIESVVAGTGLSGGGTSGDVTLNVEAAQTQITSLGTIASLVATTADINAGTFDGIVGGTTPAAATATTLTATGAFTSLGIDDNANAMAITIDSSENVGIGQTSPLALLHLKHPSGGTYLRWQDGSSNYAYEWGVENGEGNAFLLKNITGSSTPMTVKTNGRIGLGTTSPGGILDLNDGDIVKAEMKDYSETKVALSAAATVDIDLEDGNVFTLTPDQNTTFTFSNPSPTGKSCSFTLVWTQDSTNRTITWPATVRWKDGGGEPSVTQGSGKVDIYTFFTLDAGTLWYSFQAGADMA